jgi:hypothetical protein
VTFNHRTICCLGMRASGLMSGSRLSRASILVPEPTLSPSVQGPDGHKSAHPFPHKSVHPLPPSFRALMGITATYALASGDDVFGLATRPAPPPAFRPAGIFSIVGSVIFALNLNSGEDTSMGGGIMATALSWSRSGMPRDGTFALSGKRHA